MFSNINYAKTLNFVLTGLSLVNSVDEHGLNLRLEGPRCIGAVVGALSMGLSAAGM